LVEINNSNDINRPGQMLRANRLSQYQDIENGDWQFLMWDETDNRTKVPQGSAGNRWAKENKGKWNLKLEDNVDGSKIDPALTFLKNSDEIIDIEIDNFAEGETTQRKVPVKYIETKNGKVAVATVYDLLMAQYGVGRGLEGYPTSYDKDELYTPTWAEKYTGISPDTLIRFAREWASTAEHTGGKCTVIIGAGINHWYHANLMYRAAIHALMFTGCIGKNGGGLAHYVGQEKLAPGESWASIALAKDWHAPSRLQNTPSWHYIHSDQWRYEKSFTDYHTVPKNQPENTLAKGHTIDVNVKAVQNGWLPFYPQFETNPIDLVSEARENGAIDEKGVVDYVVEKLKKRDLKYSIEDPDNADNWPRVWFVWRGNAIGGSAKGHEFFLDHYLGTHTNQVSDSNFAKGSTEEVVWHDKVPQGKMDLVVDLNFRMDTSALYSDIVLPAATWYEKDDLNSTDMHSFIHPLQEAVPPAWESKSDWDIFKNIAEAFSKISSKHFPDTVEDLVSVPLLHDTPAEIAQKEIKEWIKGEVEAIPGKTMPNMKIAKRDYKNIHNQFISYGPNIPRNGLGAHGTSYDVKDEYQRLIDETPVEEWNGNIYPSLKEAKNVANTVLTLATVTNGELAYRSYKNMEEKTGLVLADLAEKNRGARVTFDDLCSQPKRLLNSPMWSGLTENGRAYSPFTYNVERLIPWRTLTGRQHFYLDHPGYIQYGEHLPTYKPKPTPTQYAELTTSESEHKTKIFNYLTPHGKWHIHSTYGDNHRMSTLSRGVEPFWINDKDAEDLGIVDNDWVEVYNDNGVVVTRANVSARIPKGIVVIYHATERTLSVPKSPLRGNKRAGMNNSLTRARLKPNLMVGGYGQFTYHFNYWGPTGANRDTYIMVRKLPILNW
jgi:nitrate reductase alpha subunit